MENKIQRNIQYIEEIIQKYDFLNTFQKSLEKIKETQDIYKINDLFRLICSIFEEKISELSNYIEKEHEKVKALKEEFSTEEYEKIKQEKENLEKELKTQIQEYESKYQELIDRYQKLSTAYRDIKTEYENHIHRTEKNFEKLKRESKERIIYNLIPVIDSFEISLKSIRNTQNIEEIIKGIELIYTQLIDVLKNEGLEIIKSNVGDQFDPSVHEAIETEETEQQEKDSIISHEYRPAYKLMDKVIRPASVKVFKLKNQSEV
ncbi:MAG: nucleotide exchange factor GrpE [bacterium]|nr:nucleotide exchange factor GrpE [bacterium]